jgi:uncharacterized protein (DUF4415 family)
MVEKKRFSKRVWRDPDDAPTLDRKWFGEADVMVGSKIVRRGRPAGTATKQPISIRLDKDVLTHFRETGAGWQARINAALRHSMRRHKLSRLGGTEPALKRAPRRRSSTSA